jgi:hypothetical protein
MGAVKLSQPMQVSSESYYKFSTLMHAILKNQKLWHHRQLVNIRKKFIPTSHTLIREPKFCLQNVF